ncbi:uncharacterized protein Eint_080190 [Encephalitozoon intestinalis ATCC 50506]|uniref:MIF4G-like type 2 domain-containing protein n=1 Tax=Encephalitozoon intestinalis (strain ATCC 50506) TaxID=876142 RepID=E0S8G1_ENCIT|nr:uncharacterized protein Eint_080190 [Encephalitozoon intestinalis ATCC 50506]ADM11955.1 hypothetical protein Eint_080190 [Encephalitozoon intestinalis ATCC 50506]UTX45739.1 hypothetical protein GPK93_08g13130 [Encephalitozoon intestinalis]
MQLPIPRINSTNYKRILAEARLSEDREKVISEIKSVILLMPHRSSIISNLINDLAEDNPEFKDKIVSMANDISMAEDTYGLISASFTFKRLGVEGTEGLFWVKEIPTTNSLLGSTSFEMPPASLDRCKKEVERMLGISNEKSFEEVFCVVQIIRSFRFSVHECLGQLGYISKQKTLVDGLRILHKEENSLYLSALILELAKKQGFLKILLEDLPLFDQEFRDILLPLVFEYFYGPSDESNSVYISSSYIPLGTSEDIDPFRRLITETTVRNMKRISGSNKVEAFLNKKENLEAKKVPRMSREEFEKTNFEDKNAFFRNFCLLGSPSVSHFLTYLEIYKEQLVLNEEEQKLFLSIFFKTFEGLESFSRIVLEKLVLFKIVDFKLLENFNGEHSL